MVALAGHTFVVNLVLRIGYYLTGSNMGASIGHRFVFNLVLRVECGWPMLSRERVIVTPIRFKQSVGSIIKMLCWSLFRLLTRRCVSGDLHLHLLLFPDFSAKFHIRGGGCLGSKQAPGSILDSSLVSNILSTALSPFDEYGLTVVSDNNSPRISTACCISILWILALDASSTFNWIIPSFNCTTMFLVALLLGRTLNSFTTLRVRAGTKTSTP